MRLAKTIHGNISPKSVVASGSGYIIAQNMMYRHSITVYDRSYRLVKTIPDRVDLKALGGAAARSTYSSSSTPSWRSRGPTPPLGGWPV